MFTFSIFIQSSQQEVFDLLSNPVNLHKGAPLMQSAAWTPSGEKGVGSTMTGIMKMVGQETERHPEVTQWDPPRRYGIKVLNEQFPFESTEYVYTLEPEDGGTRVILESEVQWESLP